MAPLSMGVTISWVQMGPQHPSGARGRACTWLRLWRISPEAGLVPARRRHSGRAVEMRWEQRAGPWRLPLPAPASGEPEAPGQLPVSPTDAHGSGVTVSESPHRAPGPGRGLAKEQQLLLLFLPIIPDARARWSQRPRNRTTFGSRTSVPLRC